MDRDKFDAVLDRLAMGIMCQFDPMRRNGVYSAVYALIGDRPDAEVTEVAKRLLGAFTPTSAVPFPPPAEWLRQMGMSQQDVDDEYTILAGKIRKAVSAIGYMHSVDFGGSANAAIDAAGGWQAVCRISEDDWPWYGKRLAESIRTYAAAGASTERCAGAAESHGSAYITHRITRTDSGRYIRTEQHSLPLQIVARGENTDISTAIQAAMEEMR